MRETRIAQASIFENYSKHEFGVRLKLLSNLLDLHPGILSLVAKDLVNESAAITGANRLKCGKYFSMLIIETAAAYQLRATGVPFVRFDDLPDVCATAESCDTQSIRIAVNDTKYQTRNLGKSA